MAIRSIAFLAFLSAGTCFAGELPQNYETAHAMWQQHITSLDYERYAEEFGQFNNYFRLDEKDGCYARGSDQVNLMLIITHPADSEFAVIERALPDALTNKAECFRNSYEGLKTKAPPFLPFVLKMNFQ